MRRLAPLRSHVSSACIPAATQKRGGDPGFPDTRVGPRKYLQDLVNKKKFSSLISNEYQY